MKYESFKHFLRFADSAQKESFWEYQEWLFEDSNDPRMVKWERIATLPAHEQTEVMDRMMQTAYDDWYILNSGALN